MATLMKALGLLVIVAGLVAFMAIQKQIPSSEKLNVFLYMVPTVVFLSALYFALGQILNKLDIVLASLDRPQVVPSAGVTIDPTPAGRFAAGSASRAVGDEPAL